MRCSSRAARIAAAVCTLWAWPAFADEGDGAQFDFALEAAGWYGRLTGFVQVPLGGNPGSTSPRRPTLREIGIDDVAGWQIEGRFRWQHFLVFGGYSWLEPDGSGTLSEPLVSHGVSFPAGSPFTSSLKLDVANVGVGWSFEFPELGLTLRPKLDVALLDFSYSLTSPGLRAARAYSDAAVRLGGEAELRLGRGFAAQLSGVASLPIPYIAQLAEIDGRVIYLVPLPGPLRTRLFLGSGIRWIDFEDAQTVPNHIHIRSGALLRGGLSIAF